MADGSGIDIPPKDIDGIDADGAAFSARARSYGSGNYWRDRSDLMYYRYVDFILRTVARDASSMIDIGTGGSPYLEWFDWIDERISFDMHPPYRSPRVHGIQGNFMRYDFGRHFDVASCLQVLEHVPEPGRFLRRLFAISALTVVSVPFKWPAGMIADHVNDPVTFHKLRRWAGRAPNFHIVVQEPFRARRRLIAVYDNRDPKAGWGRKDIVKRIRRADVLPRSLPPRPEGPGS